MKIGRGVAKSCHFFRVQLPSRALPCSILKCLLLTVHILTMFTIYISVPAVLIYCQVIVNCLKWQIFVLVKIHSEMCILHYFVQLLFN